MGRIKGKKNDGRGSDLAFYWMLTTLGPEWQQWQELTAEWIAQQTNGLSSKKEAVTYFFEKYILLYAEHAINPINLFDSGCENQCSGEGFIIALKAHGLTNSNKITSYHNIIVDFIQWIVDEELLDIPNELEAINATLKRFTKENNKHSSSNTIETVRNPLPYKFIKDLRAIISPKKDCGDQSHFSDWKWAHNQLSDGKVGGDWFTVDGSIVDKSDPDCVWRFKRVGRKQSDKQQVIQIWSPVRSMLAFVKLHLPLRTYQVRMLDSGEADTWRYESGNWIPNIEHEFSLGTDKRPFGKGIFHRIFDSMTGMYSTGLYINSNKTADQNKDEAERGYVIPWENTEVLYWLEKLRNWQEKYNPIRGQISSDLLQNKHVGHAKSVSQLNNMGASCFLFRDAAASKLEDKIKPIHVQALPPLWYRLLKELEDQLNNSDEFVNQQVSLVEPYEPNGIDSKKPKTFYPPHSLRVSLITSYAMDTDLPLPVISKLLAGHSRLLMTIYYNKITPSMMAKKMEEAEGQLEDKNIQSVRNFLKDASLEQIQCKMVYHKEDSIQAALVNRNPIGWEDRATGLCLVGGNTVKSDEVSTIGGCWNGGQLINNAKTLSSRIYSSVPHGPENCIRCRWFITEARYLPVLNAHFNQLSYKAHQAANLSVEIEGKQEALKDEQFFCEERSAPFTRHEELNALERRYEKQQVEADEYAKDWIACFELINKIIRIEEARQDDDTKDKLVAVGGEQDVNYALKFVETESELLHLSLLCDDAEFYPDLQDELRKTPAIEKRSRQLSRVLMKKGFEPIFMEMDDKQQLIAANAMLRQMAKVADPDNKMEGFRKVANYIEAGEYLIENKLLNEGMKALTDKALHLNGLTQPALLEE